MASSKYWTLLEGKILRFLRKKRFARTNADEKGAIHAFWRPQQASRAGHCWLFRLEMEEIASLMRFALVHCVYNTEDAAPMIVLARFARA